MSILGSLFRRGPAPADPPGPRVAEDERIYAVGDIHGRADLLAAMIGRIRADMARRADARLPRLIFLGDHIDRGDQSRETLDLLMALGRDFREAELTFLRGNHEAALLAFLDDPARGVDWLGYGGLQTLASYGLPPPKSAAGLDGLRDALEAAMGEHRGFLEAMGRLTFSGHVVFSHAGLDPDLPFAEQTDAALLWGRSRFLEAGGIEGIRVVHGHYAAAGPVVTPRRICVDTGAYFSGRLTAVRLDRDLELLNVTAPGRI